MNVYKGTLIFIANFYQNMFNGFSGLNIFDHYYLKLFNVIITTFCFLFFQIFDYDVEYDENATEEKPSVAPVKSNKIQTLKISKVQDIFSGNDYLNEIGITINDDGSTNKICEYTAFIRETCSTKYMRYFWLYYIWAFIGGGFVYFISMYSLERVIDDSGVVNDYWNSGVSIIYSMWLSYHLHCLLETKSHTPQQMLCFIFLSFILFWVVVNINDTSMKNYPPYKGNQWSYLFSSASFHFTSLLCACILVAPRFLWKTMEIGIFYPQFGKIKAA